MTGREFSFKEGKHIKNSLKRDSYTLQPIYKRVRVDAHQYSTAALSMATMYAALWFTTAPGVTDRGRQQWICDAITKIVDIRRLAECDREKFATVIDCNHGDEQSKIGGVAGRQSMGQAGCSGCSKRKCRVSAAHY
jgi:hypothetical protein